MEINTPKERIERWRNRPYSWSQHCSFRDYSKEEWYDKYILGKSTPVNKRMHFGSLVGKRIENDPNYIPQLPRGVMEYGINVKMGKIELTGFMDSYIPETREIHEFKTSGPDGWDQKKVDGHDQLTFYCLLLLLKEAIAPEDVTIKLHHLHTIEGQDFSIAFARPFTLTTYTTKRTTEQVLKFGAEIIKTRKEMERYVKEHE